MFANDYERRATALGLLHEAIEIALLMLDPENQPPQYAVEEAMQLIKEKQRMARNLAC